MNELKEIFEKYKGIPNTMIDGIPWNWGGDKGSNHTYIEIYHDLFKDRRFEKLNLLEIGVQYGSSMKMWKEYFENSTIYGLDLKPHCVKYAEDRIVIKIMDATKKHEIDEHLSNVNFDIIIDDGSHEFDDQVNSFKLLWEKMNPGGIYVIEDIFDIDKTRNDFLSLAENVKIMDIRHIKNVYNDVLVVIQK
jgi:23S rRNA U2552 (ribose-2'-O)-methylase RlmE/FtsJ